MVSKKEVVNNKLYENMLIKQKEALLSEQEILDRIKLYFEDVLSEKSFDYSRVILDEFGYIKLRTIEEIDIEKIDDFTEEFNLEFAWIKEERIDDFRNVEKVGAVTFEYGFVPKDISKLLGDNQIGIGEAQ